MNKNPMQIAQAAITTADSIYAGGQTVGYEQEIKVGTYRNTVAVNSSPDCQVATLLEDTARELCQIKGDIWPAVELIEAYVEAHKIGYLCSI